MADGVLLLIFGVTVIALLVSAVVGALYLAGCARLADLEHRTGADVNNGVRPAVLAGIVVLLACLRRD